MKIVIMHQTITEHDAIGNDIEVMYNILKKKHDCTAFAQNKFNNNIEYIDEVRLLEILDDKDSLIIYHHSVYWEYGEELINKSKAKLVFRYHNITPPEFFKLYNEFHFDQCDKGRKQTGRFAEKFKNANWLVDSFYNSEDIKNVNIDRITVCAPFNKIEKWAGGIPDEEILKLQLYDKNINLLFVGRVAPNKGHIFLLKILHNYCVNFNDNIKLRIIGKFDDGLSGYNKEIENYINTFGLQEHVEFIGEIDDSKLISYYLGSDFFICASEHEGFCVPIIEAQYFKLPVIAKKSSAVTETIGNSQILLDDEVRSYSAAIHILYKNRDYKNYLCDMGFQNFNNRFTYEKISNTFKDFMKNKIGVDI